MPILQTGDTPLYSVNLGDFTPKGSARYTDLGEGRHKSPTQHHLLQNHNNRLHDENYVHDTKHSSSLLESRSKHITSTLSPRTKRNTDHHHGPLTRLFLETEQEQLGQVFIRVSLAVL
jgi:hypothetical protein